MSVETLTDSLYEYLNKNGILVDPQFAYCKNIDYKNINENKVKEQMEFIRLFHKRTSSLDEYMFKRIDNKTGKTIEELKVQIRKLKKQLRNIEIKSPNNEFEELLLKKGQEFAVRAQKSLDRALGSNYIELLSRSMKNNEVCIGNSFFSNLSFENQLIIKDLGDISFNMKEMDCLYLLSKLKRKGAVLNWGELAYYYCRSESLGVDSKEFIEALLSFPYEFIKCCTRYRENKKEWSIERYTESLEKAAIKDGQSLV